MSLTSYERVLLNSLVVTIISRRNLSDSWLYYDWKEFLSDSYMPNGVVRLRPTEVTAIRNIHRICIVNRDS